MNKYLVYLLFFVVLVTTSVAQATDPRIDVAGANAATVNLRLGQWGDPSSACGTTIDPFMPLYDDSFNPASPLSNRLLINDDTNGAADRGPNLTSVSIPSGQTRVIVLTTFDNGIAFPYEVTFAGAAPVSLQSFEVD